MSVEEVISMAIRLLSDGGQPVWVVVGVALVAAVLIVVGQKVSFPKGESGPPPSNDETPAPGSPLPTDPANPGGGPTGGMG